MELEGIAQKTIISMIKEGKVITLSNNWKYNFENNIAIKFAPTKEEFYKKENASRSYIAKIESTTSEV